MIDTEDIALIAFCYAIDLFSWLRAIGLGLWQIGGE